MKKEPFLAEKSLYVFASLAAVGGFLEAFTYFHHDGVFCNAQTGNLVLLAVNLAQGQFAGALQFLFSILAYIVGILLSAVAVSFIKAPKRHCATVGLEIAALAVIACLPENTPHVVTYATVAFLCALQYNTFTECRGAALATTFCTNNLRQLVVNLYGWLREKERLKLKKSAVYAAILLLFVAGAVAGGFAVQGGLGNYSAFLAAGVLLPVFVLLLIQSLRRTPPQEGGETSTAPAPCEQNIRLPAE